MQLAGSAPRFEWRPNPGGLTRTVVEACEIARSWGGDIPEYVQFSIDEYDFLDESTTAKTTTFPEHDGTIIEWSQFFHRKTGKIPFLIREDLLESDEAIVAVIGHEMFELEMLRSVFAGGAPDRGLGGRDQPEQPGKFPLAGVGLSGRTRGKHEGGRGMIDKLILMYDRGAITGYRVMIDSLHRLDPAEPGPVLGGLPPEILDEMRAYARRYDPTRPHSSRFTLPTEAQVRAAERWIDAWQARNSEPIAR